MTRLSEEQITSLFNEPRTVSAFTAEPVTEEQKRRIQELTYMGPTAFNSQPLRITWVESDEARQRLVSLMMEGNREKTAAAPLIAILSFDKQWHKLFPTFMPPMAEAGAMFEAEEARIPAGSLNSGLQAGYFLTAIRALGLDAGPMTGADFAGIEQEFFADSEQQPFMVVNIGHGEAPAYDRAPRFGFEDVTRSI